MLFLFGLASPKEDDLNPIKAQYFSIPRSYAHYLMARKTLSTLLLITQE